MIAAWQCGEPPETPVARHRIERPGYLHIAGLFLTMYAL
jgi:hypothetical protein